MFKIHIDLVPLAVGRNRTSHSDLAVYNIRNETTDICHIQQSAEICRVRAVVSYHKGKRCVIAPIFICIVKFICCKTVISYRDIVDIGFKIDIHICRSFEMNSCTARKCTRLFIGNFTVVDNPGRIITAYGSNIVMPCGCIFAIRPICISPGFSIIYYAVGDDSFRRHNKLAVQG